MSGNSASNSPAMKKRAFIGIAIVVVVLIGVLAIILAPARESISLTLLQYHRWPHGATLKLTNNSRKNIAYLTDFGCYTPGAYTPILFCRKTENGWTNTSPPISPYPMITFIAQPSGFVVGSTNKFYSMGVPGSSANADSFGLCNLESSSRVGAPNFMLASNLMMLPYEPARCASSRKENSQSD